MGTVSGIRSTGLSASLGIAKYVHHYLLSSIILPSTKTTNNNIKDEKQIILPSLKELIINNFNNNDDMVCINNYLYKVTHPITLLGWKDYNKKNYNIISKL